MLPLDLETTIRTRRRAFLPELPIELGQEKPALISRGRKSASITLFIPFDHIVF
jgi:hypothetical protein